MSDLPAFVPNMSLAGYAQHVRNYSADVIPHIEWSANEVGDVIEIIGSFPTGGDEPDRQASRMVTPAQLAAGAEKAVQSALTVIEEELVPEDQRHGGPVF